MIISSKLEFILYCLLDSIDVLSRPTMHAMDRPGYASDLYQSLGRQSAYLVKRGLLEQEIVDQRKRIHRLTRSGIICALGGRDPQEGWERSWDGLWRLVVYDIPEADRRLRLKLRRDLWNSGFGCLQKECLDIASSR